MQALAERSVSAWDWKRCSTCGSTLTIKNGNYTRWQWFSTGRQRVRVQRLSVSRLCQDLLGAEGVAGPGQLVYGRVMRRYHYPGQSPPQVAGASPGQISYLDVLGVFYTPTEPSSLPKNGQERRK